MASDLMRGGEAAGAARRATMTPAVSDSVWTGHDTSPAEIEGALRHLLNERHAEDHRYVAARVLNLVCVVDKEWSGEIANRLSGVGRYHASRTIVCAVEPGRRKLDAMATVAADSDPTDAAIALVRETVVVRVGSEHLQHLDTIVDPLVVTDLATVVWSPHGHDEALDGLMALAQVVLLDSVDEPDVSHALHRAADLSERAYVVDLAWLRSTPWRERVAATYDPDDQRQRLRHISCVEVRHGPTSQASALLLCGWMGSRLGWKAAELTSSGHGLSGQLRGPRGEVRIELRPVDQEVRGLAGLTIETSDGASIALDRGDGGLHAVRRARDGHEREWTILGASRGEPGILGEGIRQALLRDPTYRPALQAAKTMVGAR